MYQAGLRGVLLTHRKLMSRYATQFKPPHPGPLPHAARGGEGITRLNIVTRFYEQLVQI